MAEILPSPEIWHRLDLPILCNWRRLWRAVEVGVDRAEFALAFLDRWQGSDWWGFDPYLPYGHAGTGGMPHDRQADLLMAAHRLAPHAGRAKLIRMGSVEAAATFPPGSVDFAYIDGSHAYDDVVVDLRVWWPKLSDRGILAGHDFDDQVVHQGVKQAVTEFAKQIDQTIYLTAVPGYGQESEPSWYIYKSGMPGADWRRC